jgi:hypothetical protein
MSTKNGISEMNLAQKIAAVSGKMGAISKERKKDSQLTYGYQGIDDTINSLNPLLAEYGLITYNTIDNLVIEDVVTQTKYGDKNGTKAKVILNLHVTDGVTEIVTQEAATKIDYTDKAVTQGISMAFKYALIRLFKIRTAGDLDPDEYYTDHQDIKTAAVKTKPASKPAQKTISEDGEQFLKLLATLADVDNFKTNIPKELQRQVFNLWRIAEDGEKYLKVWLATNKPIYNLETRF